MRIGFIGLGKLGLPVAETMAEKHDVIGYDISHVESKVISVTQDLGYLVRNSDMIFVAVPTPHESLYDGCLLYTSPSPRD